jgi:uncharacterized protein
VLIVSPLCKAQAKRGNFEVLEGSPIEGIVIAKFSDVKSARDWYNSEAYQSGTAHGNDWARGFMRGVHLHRAAWEELFVDELYSPLVPILALAYEHDPDPEMRPYNDGIDAERREKLILGAAAGVTEIYEYFGPERRRIAAEFDGRRRQAKRKIRRNDFCACGSGKKYKHCCGKAAG